MNGTSVLVTGSRSIEETKKVLDLLRDSPFKPDTVIHGEGSTVDEMGGVWAVESNADIDTHPIPEWVWEMMGKRAGPMRNDYMVSKADACVAIWDGESNGTFNTFSQAEAEGLPVHKVEVEVHEEGEILEIVSKKTVEGDQRSLSDYGVSND